MEETKIISYLKNLVAFQTTQDKPVEMEKCLDYIQKQLAFYPFIINRYSSNGKPMLVATTENTKQPKIFLVAHIDVVPGKQELFAMKQEGDKLFGRGVSDMKFAVAVFLTVLETLYQKHGNLPSVGLMITSEEEIEGNNGPGYLLQEHGYGAEVAIIPDGGDNWHIVEEAKGIAQMELTIQGQAGHGSRPWEGKNAIETLFDVGKTVQNLFPNPSSAQWVTTCNFGKVQGGKAFNQICDEVNLFLDIRFTQAFTVEKIMSRLQENLPETVHIRIVDTLPAFFVDRKNSYVTRWAILLGEAIGKKEVFIKETGATDGPYFAAAKIPCIVSKPEGGLIHSDNEWISLSSVMTFATLLQDFLSTDSQ